MKQIMLVGDGRTFIAGRCQDDKSVGFMDTLGSCWTVNMTKRMASLTMENDMTAKVRYWWVKQLKHVRHRQLDEIDLELQKSLESHHTTHTMQATRHNRIEETIKR